jgi:hypothetical protein
MAGFLGASLAAAAAEMVFLGRWIDAAEYGAIQSRQARKRRREKIDRRIPNHRKKGPGRKHLSGDFTGETNTRGWK